MRRVGLLLAPAILAVSASPAAAHPSPPGCGANLVELTLLADRTKVRDGDGMTFSVYVANTGLGACDVSNATVTLTLPGTTGAPNGQAITLAADQPLPAGTPLTKLADVPYTVDVDPGVTNLAARVSGTGVLHDATPDSSATQTRSVGMTASWPRLALTATATPATGIVPLNVTYEYVVTNTSLTPAPMRDVTFSGGGCTPIAYVSGDDGDNRLGDGEAWTYRCPRTFAAPVEFTSNVLANATSTVDDRLAGASQATTVVKALRPPRPVVTLKKTAEPASGVAPLAVTYTYVVGNASAPEARPAENVRIDDDGCAPIADTSGGGPLLRGETRTFTCTLVLSQPGSITSSALAKATDAFDGSEVASDASEAGATATAAPAAPAPRPADEGEDDPPPRRVAFTVNGRFARPCRGTATLQLKAGRTTVATKRARLDRRCRYRARFEVSRSRLKGATRVTVTARLGRRTATHRLNVPG